MQRATPAVALLLAGCGVLPPGTPHDAGAVFRPASMVADRETAAPGEIVELTFPDEMARGILYVLEEEIGSSWVYRYGLIASPDGAPEWFDPTDEAVEVPDIGVLGPGPDRVAIPPDVRPGSWRICTGNAGENVCVRIVITGA
jgi:hypothetical protein